MDHYPNDNTGRRLIKKVNKLFGCFSIIGVIISISYFSKLGILSEIVDVEEYPQLNSEFDQSPEFDTAERFFTIDEENMKQTNEIVFDNFVLNYDQYPEEQINQMLFRRNIFDKTGTNQNERYTPDTVKQYNNTKKDICKTIRERLQPQLAKSVDNKWCVIVNGSEQPVPIEKCQNETTSLNEELLLDNTPTLKCRQVTSKISLIVMINKELKTLLFDYESACEPYLYN